MRFTKYLVVLSALMLVACGDSAPSASNIEDAFNNFAEQKVQEAEKATGAGGLFGADMVQEMMPRYSDVVVESCEKPEGSVGYVCSFTATIETMGVKEENMPMTMTFAKTDGQWVLIGQ